MTTLDIGRTVWCPNPEYGGKQEVCDCQLCEFFGEILYSGETMICNYKG